MMDIDLGGLSIGQHRECSEPTEQGEQGQLQSYSYSQWCPWGHSRYCLTDTEDTTGVPAVTQSMNLTRDLSDILNRVLHIESSILNRILLVRRMENQHIEADVVYVNNRGQDSSEFEYRDGTPYTVP